MRSRRYVIGLLAMPLLLASCKPATNPERAFAIYDIAWRSGQRDRLLPQPRDWRRYASKLAAYADVPDREPIFSSGYNDGFDQHPDEPVSDTILDYDRDFRRGREDARQHIPAKGSSTAYKDGFSGAKHAFGRPY